MTVTTAAPEPVGTTKLQKPTATGSHCHVTRRPVGRSICVSFAMSPRHFVPGNHPLLRARIVFSSTTSVPRDPERLGELFQGVLHTGKNERLCTLLEDGNGYSFRSLNDLDANTASTASREVRATVPLQTSPATGILTWCRLTTCGPRMTQRSSRTGRPGTKPWAPRGRTAMEATRDWPAALGLTIPIPGHYNRFTCPVAVPRPLRQTGHDVKPPVAPHGVSPRLLMPQLAPN